MIVCVCNAIREKQVRAEVRGGAMGAIEAYGRLGCKPKCGQCLPFAREIVRQERACCTA